MELVTAGEYDAALRAAATSQAFRRLYERQRAEYDADGEDQGNAVHVGDLLVEGSWRAPGYRTLVTGRLVVSGVVDLENPGEFDEGGEFVALGGVTCRALAGQYGKVSYIDGDLVAEEVVNNDFNYSSLRILDGLRTRFFYAPGNPAEVGGTVELEFQNGYLLPIGGHARELTPGLRPGQDQTAIMRALIPSLGEPDLGIKMIALVRAGASIFR